MDREADSERYGPMDNYTELEEYQLWVNLGISEHVIKSPGVHLPWACLGLAAEVGEVVEIVEKGIRKNNLFEDIERGNLNLTEANRAKLLDECGDVLWYLTALASLANISLDDIMEHNIEKLNTRRYGNEKPAQGS